MPSRSISSVRRSFSVSDPSHHTIFEGFVKLADSSTHFSSGVDTMPPGLVRGEAACFCGSTRYESKYKPIINVRTNFRPRLREMQGNGDGGTGQFPVTALVRSCDILKAFR